jgi:predicted unusual protein kinase regulating ubiquinone biosynthesis (AarF/ABC1/UbiB family)
VPPLNRGVVRRLIISEFGKAPEQLFDVFDATAFAAASLGQVHQARIRGGERVAVKVQYPGIGLAVKNDLQLLKRFVLPFIRTEYITNAAREIEHRLADEVDYGLERRRTQWFHEHGQMDGVVVPRTFEEYSSAHVLTTEFMDGLHLEQWLATRPSSKQRDRGAQLIYNFCTRSLAELCTVHSDPNPGNYLFRNDGAVAVIDFGSAKTLEPTMCERVLAHRRAVAQGDTEQILACYAALGAARGDRRLLEEFYCTALAPLDEWARLPFQYEVFDFGKHPDYCARGVAMYRNIMAHKAMNGYTAEPLLFHRTLYGLYQLFTRLRARVRMKNQWTC